MGFLQIIVLIVVAAMMGMPMTTAGLSSMITPWAWISAAFFVLAGFVFFTSADTGKSCGTLLYLVTLRVIQLVTAVAMAVAFNSEAGPWVIVWLVINVLSMLGSFLLG